MFKDVRAVDAQVQSERNALILLQMVKQCVRRKIGVIIAFDAIVYTAERVKFRMLRTITCAFGNVTLCRKIKMRKFPSAL